MSTEITVLTKQDLEGNPSIIGENLAQLALAIEDTKYDLCDIQNRNFWKRLTNNNTRDLAGVMLKQNDTISAFLVIVQGIMFLSMNNIIVLGGIMDALNKAEEANDIRDNKYIGLAKEYLTEALKSAQRSFNNEKEIENINKELTIYNVNQEKQDNYLLNLKNEFSSKNEEDNRKLKLIEKMSHKLEEQNRFIQNLDKQVALSIEIIEKQKSENKRHFELINGLGKNLSESKQTIVLQHKENERQNELIHQLQQVVLSNVEKITKQELNGNRYGSQIEQLELEVKFLRKSLKVAYIIGGTSIILAILAMILVLLK